MKIIFNSWLVVLFISPLSANSGNVDLGLPPAPGYLSKEDIMQKDRSMLADSYMALCNYIGVISQKLEDAQCRIKDLEYIVNSQEKDLEECMSIVEDQNSFLDKIDKEMEESERLDNAVIEFVSGDKKNNGSSSYKDCFKGTVLEELINL